MSRRKTVLVAESDGAQAKELSVALSDQGLEVIQARDAVSATAAVLRQRPDAVILNHRLPGGGGLNTLRRIRASVHTAMTPVIGIAGLRERDADELRLHGADEVAPSPPDVVAVTAWIQKRLGEPLQVMEAPVSIIRDSERLASLTRTGLLDSQPSESYDTLTRIASALLSAPVALVSLVDSNRQFFKSHIGLPEPWAATRETPLTHSFCQWVVSDHDALIVSDASEHPVLRNNRAFHDLGVVAYAGVPLTPTSGDPIGSFCAIDTKPHVWSDDDVMLLRELSRVAEACIAVDEFNAWQNVAEQKTGAKNIERSLIMQAVGEGISPIARILRRDDPLLGGEEREALLNLMEWLGQQLVRVAGT